MPKTHTPLAYPPPPPHSIQNPRRALHETPLRVCIQWDGSGIGRNKICGPGCCRFGSREAAGRIQPGVERSGTPRPVHKETQARNGRQKPSLQAVAPSGLTPLTGHPGVPLCFTPGYALSPLRGCPAGFRANPAVSPTNNGNAPFAGALQFLLSRCKQNWTAVVSKTGQGKTVGKTRESARLARVFSRRPPREGGGGSV